ncbi:MAG TPA: hypothetical protein VLL97_11220, partial [Acidobacteriota bacterium]|nr:hypothetical protein [Acidobacteriota bacterium]
AGEIETITRSYADKSGAAKVKAEIDSIVFADGSTYGPDTLKRRAAYIAGIETRYLFALSLYKIFETEGPEAVRQRLMRIIETPNPAIPMSSITASEAYRNQS